MSRTADQIVGNRIRVHKPVVLEARFPGSGTVIQLPAGRLTPVVQGWVTKNGKIYWQLNEVGTSYYLRHDPDFKVVADSGGADFLNPKDETGLSLFNFGKGATDTAELIKKIAIGGAILGGVMILFKVKEISIN